MRSEETTSVVRGWQRNTNLEAVVWDGAPSHRSQVVQDLGFSLVQQPAYAPELNPVEQLIEELRRVVEGKLYDTVDAKVAAIEVELQKWDVDADRVRRLGQTGTGSGIPSISFPTPTQSRRDYIELV
jgi:transposase